MGEKKENKYKAEKTDVGKITFHSKKEAERYIELKELQKQGKIKDLGLQPSFLLLETVRTETETLRRKKYIADFIYYDCETNTTVVEDVKGFKTKDYNLKKHMFLIKYGDKYKFKEV